MRIVAWCQICDCRIYDDERYFEFDGYYFCEDCVKKTMIGEID